MKAVKVKKLGTLTAAALIVTSVLAGCGDSKTSAPAQGTAAPGATAPLPIKMVLNFDGKEFPQPGNTAQTEIEKYTNTKLQISAISSNDFCSKLPVMIASGDLPQIIASCGTPSQSYLISAVQSGAFWDITPFIKDYKNLAQMPQLVYDNIKIDGKVFGVPRYRPISRYTFAYRKDWLDNVGLQQPKTVDDLYNMLKAFTNNDPDKNGKNDTFGITAMIKNSSLSPDFGVLFGAPYTWGVKDGKFIKAEETPEYLESLKFTKKLYDEKLMNQDFASIDIPKNEGDLENGKAGVISAATNNLIAFQSRVQSHNPNGILEPSSALEGPKGKFVQGERGSNGILMFPKASVKTEAELKQLLGFIDKLSDKPMADLLEWGIQGKHYDLKDGKAVRTNQETYDNEVGFPYNKPLVTVPLEAIKTPGQLDPMVKKQLDVEADNSKYAVVDPTMVLISPTWTTKGQELLTTLTDAKVKYIMGKIDEAGWKAAIEKYKKAGGDQAAQEYADAYAKAQKK
ncbi:putative aldouronate transport system substrate-binding protein [Paenibacillus sp. 1_12]|uniref:extracellular solute-binding protein n=1 Tax=Paenibacillus sp. 1_12 TaxID=1566278 RepID=UPI0008F3D5EB|nr:extracellular solute-binding protein [Paenibacillus sp. 1_12]SFK82265.1 putative aldouronate transport system substrate-binding protein [Paenibacillus sp. 1_12]